MIQILRGYLISRHSLHGLPIFDEYTAPGYLDTSMILELTASLPFGLSDESWLDPFPDDFSRFP